MKSSSASVHFGLAPSLLTLPLCSLLTNSVVSILVPDSCCSEGMLNARSRYLSIISVGASGSTDWMARRTSSTETSLWNIKDNNIFNFLVSHNNHNLVTISMQQPSELKICYLRAWIKRIAWSVVIKPRICFYWGLNPCGEVRYLLLFYTRLVMKTLIGRVHADSQYTIACEV